MSDDADIVIECEMERPPETVWRAITRPELVETWLGVEHRDRAAPGAQAWEIVEAEPNVRLRYRWTDPSATPAVSYVTFELAALPAGRTQFRLTHRVEARAGAPAAANSNGPRMLRAA